MPPGIPEITLTQLSAFIAAHMGLHFPRDRWRDLERGIGSAARVSGFNDAESYTQWLMSSPLTKTQMTTLASHLTVGETYFFRDQKGFAMLETHILPALVCSRRGAEQRLRIWSAGCCTGEEPYSIAILLNKMLPDLQDWHITILATDMHPHFLQKAQEGVYSEWSFRDAPVWLKERYFKRTQEGRFAILPGIKRMVTFSYLNLAEDAYPSLLNNTHTMDLIFCRNVLMYFAPEQAKKAVQRLYRALVESGWLIVSPSEASHILFSQFTTVNFPGAIFYQKDRHGSRGVEDLFVKERPCPPSPEETLGPLQPMADLVAQPKPEVSFPLDEPLVLEDEERTAAEPQSKPYHEALTLYQQGRYAEAVEKIEAGLSRHPADAQALALRARIDANLGKLAEALKWCEQAIRADKLDPGYHHLLAAILQEQGQVEAAMKSLKRALYLDPNFVLAHFALGNLTQQQGRFKESKKHFGNALSLLRAYRQEDCLPASEGMTAGRLMEMIRTMRTMSHYE
jgi:chemotaxis protein methyltransferase CheR